MLKQIKSPFLSFRSRRLWMCCFAVLMALPTGCQFAGSWSNNALTDAFVISYRDMVWAKRAYNLRYGNCQRPYERHFENGFCSGYNSVCNGGQGAVPTLPPESYRSYEYQTADGENCIKAWFEGYPSGVAAARKDDAGTYHNVIVSRLVEAATEPTKFETPDGLTDPGIPIVKGEVIKDQLNQHAQRARQAEATRQLPPITQTPLTTDIQPFPRTDNSSSSIAELPPILDGSKFK